MAMPGLETVMQFDEPGERGEGFEKMLSTSQRHLVVCWGTEIEVCPPDVAKGSLVCLVPKLGPSVIHREGGLGFQWLLLTEAVLK